MLNNVMNDHNNSTASCSGALNPKKHAGKWTGATTDTHVNQQFNYLTESKLGMH